MYEQVIQLNENFITRIHDGTELACIAHIEIKISISCAELESIYSSFL